MTYQQAIREAKERYKAAQDAAAADVVFICREFGKPRATVCKEIAGEEGWGALDAASKRFEKRAGQTADQARQAREKAAREGTIRSARALAKKDADAAADMIRGVAKVRPDTVLQVAAEQAGQTRAAAPSNKAAVEQAFGPHEFNRLEDAIEAVVERLPDLAPNREDKKYGRDLADKAAFVAEALRNWADGVDVGSEVEGWLKAR